MQEAGRCRAPEAFRIRARAIVVNREPRHPELRRDILRVASVEPVHRVSLPREPHSSRAGCSRIGIMGEPSGPFGNGSLHPVERRARGHVQVPDDLGHVPGLTDRPDRLWFPPGVCAPRSPLGMSKVLGPARCLGCPVPPGKVSPRPRLTEPLPRRGSARPAPPLALATRAGSAGDMRGRGRQNVTGSSVRQSAPDPVIPPGRPIEGPRERRRRDSNPRWVAPSRASAG